MNWIPLRFVCRPVTLLLVGISILVLLRGHNEPGGGFIGGLLAASGFVIYGLSFGSTAARQLLRIPPARLIGVGLLVAAASGLPALLSGRPFLTAQWWGQLLQLGKAGTVLFFDIGVYLVVFGTVAFLLLELLDPETGHRGEEGP